MRVSKKAVALLTATSLVIGMAGVASADTVTNDIVSVSKELPVAVDGTGSTKISVINQDKQADGGANSACNLQHDNTEVTLSVTSSDTDVATVSPSSITITDCDEAPGGTHAKPVTITGKKNGRATISFAITAVRTWNGGSFNDAPADFTAVVGTGLAGPSDTDAPTWSCSPATASSAWQAAEGTHSCTGSDASGLKTGSPATFTLSTNVGTGTENSSASTNSQLLCDIHDNCTTAGPITGWKIDRNAPTITDAGPMAEPNGAGWYKTDVVNQFAASDGGSGLADVGQSSFTKTTSGEGRNVTVSSGSVDDAVGNRNTGIASGEFNIDKTKPTNEVTGVSHGSTYTVGSVPAVGCNTSDALSGVATQATLSTSGGPVGSVTATCTGGTDNAGNAADVASATFRVVYPFDGFYEPIDNNGVFNKVKAGSGVPVKFSLGGDYGLGIFPQEPSVKGIACPANLKSDLVEQTVQASSSGLKYDGVAGQYNYTWKTSSGYAGNCIQLSVHLNDGTVQTANFQFTK